MSPESIEQEQFQKYFTQHYQKLISMEQSKHLPPKFSYALRDIAEHYGILAKPTLSSTYSQLNTVSTKTVTHPWKQKRLKVRWEVQNSYKQYRLPPSQKAAAIYSEACYYSKYMQLESKEIQKDQRSNGPTK